MPAALYKLWAVVRDGRPTVKFECPGCVAWIEIDDDQYRGRVSILCRCGFHETINVRQLAIDGRIALTSGG